MKIVYVANHGPHHAQDEEAVTYALTSIGHQVNCIAQENGHVVPNLKADLLLFNKWYDPVTLRKVRYPKIFWYWDLVNFTDPLLASRCASRMNWMREITPLVDLGFCTDGAHVSEDRSGKLVWLNQGADERYAGFGQPYKTKAGILFTGISSNGGRLRGSFVQEMSQRYNTDFFHITHGVYTLELRNLIASSEIVVAPDSPITNNYWSNRVYGSLGYGAFLIHPYSHGLTYQYRDAEHLVYYHDRRQLHYLIETYLNNKSERERIAAAGLKHTLEHHTYRHRCQELIRVVKERLCL